MVQLLVVVSEIARTTCFKIYSACYDLKYHQNNKNIHIEVTTQIMGTT